MFWEIALSPLIVHRMFFIPYVHLTIRPLAIGQVLGFNTFPFDEHKCDCELGVESPSHRRTGRSHCAHLVHIIVGTH